MRLSKLYDWDSRSITLRTLINELDSIGENDLDPQVYKNTVFVETLYNAFLLLQKNVSFKKKCKIPSGYLRH